MKIVKNVIRTGVITFSISVMTQAFAEDATEAAKKLANPIAAMISVPIEPLANLQIYLLI
jgi:hypothetical protein